MDKMLTKIKKAVNYITHMSNEDKASHMDNLDLGWSDIITTAEDLYIDQTTGVVNTWSAQQHRRDPRTPSRRFNANLSQSTAHLSQSS